MKTGEYSAYNYTAKIADLMLFQEKMRINTATASVAAAAVTTTTTTTTILLYYYTTTTATTTNNNPDTDAASGQYCDTS